MQNTQKNLGGVGIACNQCFCDDPLQIIIIGTDDLNLRMLAETRYPDEVIPNSTIMINPNIIECSDDTFFLPNGEGCLSVLSSTLTEGVY